jgi:hypothetical protein
MVMVGGERQGLIASVTSSLTICLMMYIIEGISRLEDIRSKSLRRKRRLTCI